MVSLLKKITAPNGGVFTGKGTNTYLIGKDEITVVDPGPNIPEHIENIINHGNGRIKQILVTHTHTDHSPAALPLSKELEIPMYGRLVDGKSDWEDETFKPHKILNHGDIIESQEYSIEVIHTPGHASNHLCFYLKKQKCLEMYLKLHLLQIKTSNIYLVYQQLMMVLIMFTLHQTIQYLALNLIHSQKLPLLYLLI